MAGTEATIVNYRMGKHTEHTSQYIVKISGVESKEDAKKHVGKFITWKTSTGKNIHGKITDTHGNGGALLARFEKGLPGQALGTKASVE
ncbi:50S ribosomal protein L35ae [Candidatus Micrarchaeota archaeon]|nr:50S ribosomal protein L35ae [Candidatus Micrarchaeota archaeon]